MASIIDDRPHSTVVHQFWMSEDDSPPPADVLEIVEHNKRLHPDFTFRLWTYDQVKPVLKELGALEAVESCRFIAMKSDIIRLGLLVRYGGVWVDLKVQAVKPCFHLFTNDVPTFVEHWPTEDRPTPSGHLINSIMGAPEQDKVIIKLLFDVCKNVLNQMQGSVYSITGGGMINKLIRDENNSNILLCHPFDFWNSYAKRVRASYFDPATHWSKLEHVKPLYKLKSFWSGLKDLLSFGIATVNWVLRRYIGKIFKLIKKGSSRNRMGNMRP